MKKFFTAIVALMLAVPSFAQFASGGFELDKKNLYYGARMGLSMGMMSGDIDATGMKAGLNLAGVIGLRVSEKSPVFLESGLYYTQRGGKKDDYTMNLKYLEVPIVIKYGIKATDDIALLPFIGPYFSWGIGGKYEFPFEVIDNATGNVLRVEEADRSSYDLVNHGDMGMKVGCGLEYDMLYLEIGGQIGIANIADDKGTIHSNALFVNFGVNF